ncbi:glycerophosphodiester phosphodiesterase family protein [Pseudactinotalea sp. Z1748]|uniref:glycerophosphodiester phosphodiesterase family protein n=1 Tax=Pseudactinotalea sp. Z1748 TaxID=3413027 RepID=UPI003C7AD5EB
MSAAAPRRRRPLTPRQRQVAPVGGRYLDRPPLAMAHRGGAGYAPNAGNENTIRAFANAVELGYDYIETDVRASADGEAFCFHDDDLVRVVGQERLFGELSGEQIRSLRTVGGESIPSLAEVLEAFPDTRFNIDVKTDDVLEPMLGVLDEFEAYHRVLIGSFSSTRLNLARRERPHLATSTSPRESMGIGYGVGPAATRAARSGALCLQVPIRYRGRRVLTPRTVRAAKRQNLQVHAWTIDEAPAMHSLLDLGVDAIITDRPEVLKDVLIARGQWRGTHSSRKQEPSATD